VKSSIALQAGVVHCDVQRTEMIDFLGEHRLDFVLIADVRLDRDRVASTHFDRVRDLLCRRGIDHVIDHDVGSACCESECHRFSNSAVRSGHERWLSLEHNKEAAGGHLRGSTSQGGS
jgi:hypothetical protein